MSLDTLLGLRCTVCAEDYDLGPARYVCDGCGPVGALDVVHDLDRISASWSPALLAADDDPTMWRWLPLLAVDPTTPRPTLTVGPSPLYDVPGLAASAGIARLWVKDEGRLPTASLKDRASAMAVVKATEAGMPVVTTASTGNAAAALAGMCAGSDRTAVIFVPEAAPEAKVAQLLAYGATVVLVEGRYGDAFDLSVAAADRYGWYNRNTGINPYMTEGKKTVALEMCEQLGFDTPDAVFVSVGDGSIIGGVHAGLAELHALGWIDRMPRLYGVQAAGSDYLVRAFEVGEDVIAKPPITASTVADSIEADLPRDRVKAMRAVRDTGGAFVRVPDAAILAAIPALGAACGVFAEPAAAAAHAGLLAAVDNGLVGGDDRVVTISTGSGLKDVRSAMTAVATAGIAAIRIPPDIEALDRAMTAGRTGR